MEKNNLNESIIKMQRLMLIEDINGKISQEDMAFKSAVTDNIKSILGIINDDMETYYDEYTFTIKVPFDKTDIDKFNKIERVKEKYKQALTTKIDGDKGVVVFDFIHKSMPIDKMDENEVVIPTSDGTQKTASASEKMEADKSLKAGNVVKFVKP